MASHQRVKYNPQTKNICLLGVRMGLKHLRSDVTGSALTTLELTPVDHFRKAKINELHHEGSSPLDHHILELDVSVHVAD